MNDLISKTIIEFNNQSNKLTINCPEDSNLIIDIYNQILEFFGFVQDYCEEFI